MYEDSSALCPQTTIIQLPKALSEGQGAQPDPSGHPADWWLSATCITLCSLGFCKLSLSPGGPAAKGPFPLLELKETAATGPQLGIAVLLWDCAFKFLT